MSLASQIINTLVEQNLPLFTSDKVYFFNLSNATRHYRLEFYRPSNYTKVVARQIVGRENGEEIYGETVLYSDHDSAWRSDGTECFLRDTKISSLDSIDPFGLEDVKREDYREFLSSVKRGELRYTKDDMDEDFKKQEEEYDYEDE